MARPESDVEGLFSPLAVVIVGLVLVFGGVAAWDVWMFTVGVSLFFLGCAMLAFWDDIRKHPEKWKSVR